MAFSFTGSGSRTGFRFSPSSKTGGLTLNQALALQALQNREPDSSFLGGMLGAGKHALGSVLGVIARPGWAVSEGARRGLEGEGFDIGDFIKGASRGIQGKAHTTMSDVLKQEGVLKGHGRWRAVAGFGLDVVTDPLMLATVAATVVTGGAASPLLAGRLALNQAAKKGALSGDTIAARKALDDAHRLFDEAGDIGRAHREWIRMEKSKLGAVESGRPWTEMDEIALNMAQRDAVTELESNAVKRLQPQLIVPLSRGKRIPLAPARLGPKAPSLARTAAGAGVVGKLPGATAVAGKLGTLFKHGFNEEEFAKPALIAQHGSELLMDRYAREAQARFGPYRHLSEDDKLAALKFGEETPDIVMGTGRALNEQRLAHGIAAGELTADQANFLRSWHQYFENLRVMDRAAGIHYEKELGNKVYVPHVYTRDGGVATKSVMGAVGYSMERVTQHSVAELKRLKESGLAKGHNLETDIMALAATRTRRAAQAQARQLLKDHMRRVHGDPVRIYDAARMAKADEIVTKLEAKLDELPTLNPQKRGQLRSAGYRKLERKVRKRLDEAYRAMDKRVSEIDELWVKHVSAGVARASGNVPRTPAWTTLTKLSDDKFDDAIKHFDEADRKVAKTLKATSREVRRLRATMKRMSAKSAHGSKYRDLADEAMRLGKRVGLSGGDRVAVTTPKRDLSKQQIGYQKQPQGRSRIADEKAVTPPRPAPKKRPGESLKPAARGESWKGNIEIHLEEIERRARNEWAGIQAKYPNTATAGSKGVIANLEKARLKAQQNYVDRVNRIMRAAELEKNKVDNLLEERMAKELDRGNRIRARIDQIEAAKPNYRKINPAIPKDAIRLESKINGEQYAFPPQVHKAMSRVERILDDEEMMGNLSSSMRKAMSYWKLGVTTINPGYRVRNTVSDLWNMYIAGVPAARIAQFGARAADMQTKAYRLSQKLAEAHAAGKNYPLTKAEKKLMSRMEEAYNHGVMSGLFQGDIQTVAAMYRSGSVTKAFIDQNKPHLALVRWAQTFNRNGENWGRLTHYLYRREYERLGASEAADWVKKAHFDYEELTPFEAQRLKMWLPFYTWSRKNIPYQLVQMVSRPGKFATFGKVVQTSNELATGDNTTLGAQEGLMPDWMREKLAFRIPGGTNAYHIPQAGITDLAKITNPRELGQLLGPQLKLPYEILTGKSMLTGEDISGGAHARKPISNAAAQVLQFIPGTDVGPTSRNVRGEKVVGMGANPWVGYIAGQLPWLNQLVNRQATIRQEQQGHAALPWASFAGGVAIYERDLETEQTVAQIEFQEQMQRLMRSLRDMGLVEESKPKKPSEFQQQLNKLLAGG